MNHNGTLAIIFIYLMTLLPLFKNERSCLFPVYGTSVPGSKVNLYSRFKERLNATSNFAQSEYDVRTSNALSSIYDLAGDILSQQLKQARTESDSQNGNYADKLLDGENFVGFEDTPSLAVASSKTNTDTSSSADAIAAEKNLQLINTPMIVSNVGQSDYHRQARKTQKACRILRHSPLIHLRNLYPPTTTEKRQSSRPSSLPSFAETFDAGRGKLSTISSESRERPYAILEQQQVVEQNIDGCSTLRGNRSSHDAGSGQKMNGLAMESIDSGSGGNIGDDDDSTKPVGSSSVKWRKKLQIDGNTNNLRKSRSWTIPFGKEQSNGLIQSGEDVDGEEERDEEMRRQQHDSVGDVPMHGTHICTRSTDSFPGVFAHPLVESSSAPIIGSGNELNEAIKNANSLLTSVQAQDVARNSDAPIINLDDSSHRIGKQIQALSGASLNGPNTAGTKSATGLIATDSGTANITNVMEKVLDELESLKECKDGDEMQPEGSPCDVAGSWNSETIGLQFHISIANPSTSSRTFIEGKRIDIELTERVPPRQHDLMECDWFLTGSTVKQVGGPFYMTAQKADRFIVATFAGLCKTCGGIPTIFGTWTFVYPARDCQDISLAVENKRDILRRDTLEAKRKHRRDRLRSKAKGKCSHGLF